MSEVVRVEVVYALPEALYSVQLVLARGATLGDALAASGLPERCDLSSEDCSFGIFGKRCETGHVLADGDRVDILRPLLLSPNEARLARARATRKRKASARRP